MCLQIIATISSDAKSRISADRLSELTGLRISKTKLDGDSALLISVTGGCSCEFLSEQSEFDCEEWSLVPERLPALADAVAALARECKQFSLVAHWLNGERPRTSRAVSAARLAALVNENRLGNNVLYRIG